MIFGSQGSSEVTSQAAMWVYLHHETAPAICHAVSPERTHLFRTAQFPLTSVRTVNRSSTDFIVETTMGCSGGRRPKINTPDRLASTVKSIAWYPPQSNAQSALLPDYREPAGPPPACELLHSCTLWPKSAPKNLQQNS